MEKIKEIMEVLNQKGIEVEIREVLKNNTQMKGYLLKTAADSENNEPFVCPVLYIEELLKEGRSVEEIISIALKALGKENFEFNVNKLMNWDTIEDSLRVRLIPRKNNDKFLENKVYEDFLDMAVVPYLDLGETEDGNYTTVISEQLLNSWGKTKEQVLDKAKENCRNHDSISIRSMADVLSAFQPAAEEEFEAAPIWVALSGNPSGNFGARVLLNPEFVQKIEEMSEWYNSDFYILPSSVHEVLLVKADDGSAKELANLIQSVNSTELVPSDILSDHPYLYTMGSNKISCC